MEVGVNKGNLEHEFRHLWIVRSVMIDFISVMHLTEESHVAVSGFLTFDHSFYCFIS